MIPLSLGGFALLASLDQPSLGQILALAVAGGGSSRSARC